LETSLSESQTIAYFSMEIALANAVPTYSGGLGVLAGDTVRAAADLGLPMVGLSLLHRAGYFAQSIDDQGRQHEAPVKWDPASALELTVASESVAIEGREVKLRAWRYDVRGAGGDVVPVFLLDADVEGNEPEDRRLTDNLYGGDHFYRLCQELILGVGGVRILRSLGYKDPHRYHMNEGHSSLLTAELLRERSTLEDRAIDDEQVVAWVRERCCFTTHTPVAAGHDKFDLDMVRGTVGSLQVLARSPLFVKDGLLDTTHAAMNLSSYTNAVSKKHAEVARAMFPGRAIDSITNGVHPATWAAAPVAGLLDKAAPGWRADGVLMRKAEELPPADLEAAHRGAKGELIARVNRELAAGAPPFDGASFTIGCARRATPYKRLDLILSDPARLRAIAAAHGTIQIVFAGKAHPRDGGGKDLIANIIHRAGELARGAVSGGVVRVAFLPGYDMDLARLLVSGSDVWLNTPIRPLEASGTSGMKAAMNGVPSLSVPDGWWLEGCDEGVTGWAIGGDQAVDGNEQWRRDAASIYEKLEKVILPLYYAGGEGFALVRRGALAHNGAGFNTHRMVREYAGKAWGLGS
jgi:glycogen phosphorylase